MAELGGSGLHACEKYLMMRGNHCSRQIKKDATMYDALRAACPRNSFWSTQARAMEIIAAGKGKQGVYAGAVGCLGFNGNSICVLLSAPLCSKINWPSRRREQVSSWTRSRKVRETLRKAKSAGVHPTSGGESSMIAIVDNHCFINQN